MSRRTRSKGTSWTSPTAIDSPPFHASTVGGEEEQTKVMGSPVHTGRGHRRRLRRGSIDSDMDVEEQTQTSSKRSKSSTTTSSKRTTTSVRRAKTTVTKSTTRSLKRTLIIPENNDDDDDDDEYVYL
eukprot:TRINITY_DN8340_c1_g1_i1.p1 TRINITY_DN8340_c1_g1~~TRINITY_DN8340_c1_g1_i1.p1  ORF type:complete len:141 (-),score=25.39 TRINITY_DN8340_c1_g1_i1:19-399(-)